MLRVAAVLTVLAAVLGAGAASSSGAIASPCTRAAAKAAMLASPALRPVWPTLRVGGGVDTLICHDFTRDGAQDMAATVFSGGTAGDVAWVVFRQRAGRWSLVLRVLQVYKVGLFRVGNDLVESTPVYRKNDPNCCWTYVSSASAKDHTLSTIAAPERSSRRCGTNVTVKSHLG